MQSDATIPSPPPSPEPPLRTCPSCGAQARTRFERCRACGESYFATPRATVRRRRVLVGAVVVLLTVASAAGGVVLLGQRSDRAARDRVEHQRQVELLRARLTRVQAPHRGSATRLRPPPGAGAAGQLAARAALVVAVQDAITRDARARMRAGELDGPIAETLCGPLLKSKEAIPDDRVLSKAIGRYDCVAVKRPIEDATGRRVASLGHPFVAALDFERFTYTWCRNTPPPGEAGQALATVRLERACLAATGPPLGTGYVDVPGTQGRPDPAPQGARQPSWGRWAARGLLGGTALGLLGGA